MDQDYVRLKDLKPVLAGYLTDSLEHLKRAPVPDDNAVHDMRVLLKKSRAVLKLIEPQIESEFKQKDIQSLKEAAKFMSVWRDSTVHRKTIKDLKKEYPDLFVQLKDNERLNKILLKQETSAEPTPEIQETIGKIEEQLKKTIYRVRFRNMQDLDAQLLLKEIENTYLRVVDQYLICRNSPKEAKLHELRKKSKEFLYQLYFFRPLNPSTIKSLEKKLELFTRNLGKINDHAQLVKALEYKYPNDLNNPALDELVVRIREKQDKYLKRIWPFASKTFCPGRKLVSVLGYKILVI